MSNKTVKFGNNMRHTLPNDEAQFRSSGENTRGVKMARMLNNAHSAFGQTGDEAYLFAANQNKVPDGPTVTNTFTNSFSQNNDDRFEHQLASRFGYGYGYENRGGYRKTKRNQKRKKKQLKVKSKRSRSKKNRRKSSTV